MARQIVEFNTLQAARMNQEGAMHLVSGRVDRAATWFVRALDIVSGTISSMSCDRPFPVASLGRNATRSHPISESRGFLYAKPFFFTQEGVEAQGYACACVAVIGFNLALAYHLEGLALVDGGSFLTMAKSMYGMSLKLLFQQQNCDCSNVIIALLNNLACLNAELGCFDESHRMILLLTMLVKERKVKTNTIDGHDFSDVLLNIRMLLMPACAGAA